MVSTLTGRPWGLLIYSHFYCFFYFIAVIQPWISENQIWFRQRLTGTIWNNSNKLLRTCCLEHSSTFVSRSNKSLKQCRHLWVVHWCVACQGLALCPGSFWPGELGALIFLLSLHTLYSGIQYQWYNVLAKRRSLAIVWYTED